MGAAGWGQIKLAIEAKEGRSLTNSVFSNLLNALVKSAFIVKVDDKYSITDSLLVVGFERGRFRNKLSTPTNTKYRYQYLKEENNHFKKAHQIHIACKSRHNHHQQPKPRANAKIQFFSLSVGC